MRDCKSAMGSELEFWKVAQATVWVQRSASPSFARVETEEERERIK